MSLPSLTPARRAAGRGVVTLALLAAVGVPHVASQTASAAVAFAPHTAVYEMTMTRSRTGGSVVNVAGRMSYRFEDACDAWTTGQKFLLRYDYAEGPGAQFNSQYDSWETKDFKSYSFSVRRTRDGQLVEEFRGSTARPAVDAAGKAEFAKPEQRVLEIAAGTLFPTQHTMRAIEIAKSGGKFLNAQVFDGSDGEGATEVNAVIGPVTKPPEGTIKSPLLDSPARRIRFAYYPTDTSEAAPEYEMTLLLHENGVVSDMEIDYEDFSLHGRLQALDPVTGPHC